MDGDEPSSGERFAGRYRIRSLVASGSMGTVYEAEQEPLGRVVALKVLEPDASARRFLREASLLGRLSHPNTVRVLDYGVEQDRPFLVMELVRGQTLRQVLRDRIDPVRVVRIARQICGSLSEAHESGLVHRDLKPANVLVCRGPDGEDQVKVVDFGLVKEMEDAVHMTGEGLMVGTPMFMAPEQIRGRKLDQRVDIYALGVVLYRAWTGRYPFEPGHPASVLVAHITDPPRPFADDLGLPECLEWTVLRCLEKAPSGRFANVRELDRALKLCEAALLDEAAARRTRLSLVEGRLVLPDAADGQLPLARPRLGGRGVAAAVVASMCLLFAASFGFVVLRGISAATRLSPEVAKAEPARVVAPSPPMVEEEGLTPVRKVEPVKPPPPIPLQPQPEPEPEAPADTLEVRATDLIDPWAE